MKVPKINLKKEGTHAALGTVIGLATKYGTQALANQANNQTIAEVGRRAANVLSAYAGKGTGELAFQATDGVLNLLVQTQGGQPPGGAPGEFA